MFGPDVFPPISISSETAAAPGKSGPSTRLPFSVPCHTPPLPTFPMGAASTFSGRPCGCQGQTALKSKVWPGVGASFSYPQGPSKHTLSVKLLRFSCKLCFQVSLPASFPTDVSQGRVQEGILGPSSSILSIAGLTTTQLGMSLGRKGHSRPGVRGKVPAMSPGPLSLTGNRRRACKTRSFKDFSF